MFTVASTESSPAEIGVEESYDSFAIIIGM